MKAIIFGAGGQDGVYLARLLENSGVAVTQVGRKSAAGDTDLASFDSVATLIRQVQPDYIFHLAAVSSVSHQYILENHQTICTGTIHILEAVKQFCPAARVFISGSALQFQNDGHPISEKNPFEARDAYSLCRIQSVLSARYYRSLGIKTYVGYFFNHDSPLRSERHMTKKIAEAAKRIAAGSKEQLMIGDLGAIKEYTFAGDVVNAVWTLVNQDAVSEAVIGSGIGFSITDWLEACFGLAGKNWQDHVVRDEQFVSGYRRLVADPALIRSLGWEPAVDFKQLAQMMMQ